MSSRFIRRPCLITDGEYRAMKDDAWAFVHTNTCMHMPVYHIHRYPKETGNDYHQVTRHVLWSWIITFLKTSGQPGNRAPGLHAWILKLRNTGLTPCCLLHAVWSEANCLTSLCPSFLTLAEPQGRLVKIKSVKWHLRPWVLSSSCLPCSQPGTPPCLTWIKSLSPLTWSSVLSPRQLILPRKAPKSL